MENNLFKDYKQRYPGDEREACVEISTSGRSLRLAIGVNTTAADVKIWSELPCGIPSDVLSLEMGKRKLADHEVILKSALAKGEIPLKLTLSPWWLKFVSACMRGDGEQVRARINIKMSGINQGDRIFVAAFTAAQRGDHSLLFSVIAGRKIDAERRVELSGRTLLHAAIFGGTISCVTNILVNGGNSLLETPDVTGESPVQLAHRLHGDGKILQLLHMYLELHRRESSRDIWSLIDNEKKYEGESSTADLRCKSGPEDEEEWSCDKNDLNYLTSGCCKTKESDRTSHGTPDFENNIPADNSQSMSNKNETKRAFTEDGRLEGVLSNHMEHEKQMNNSSCQVVPQRTKSDGGQSEDTNEIEKVLEISREHDAPHQRKPIIPSLLERRKMSRQRRNAHALAGKSSDSTTNVACGDQIDSLEHDLNKLDVEWQGKTSDSGIVKTHDETKQRRKGIFGFSAQVPLVRRKLERSLQEPPTFKLESHDPSPGSSSSGDEFASVSDLYKGVRKPAGSAQSDKGRLLPVISVIRNCNNASVSSDRQGSEKHVHSSACVKPPLLHTQQAKKTLLLSVGSARNVRQRKQSQPIFGSPKNLAPGSSLARSRRQSFSGSPLLSSSPPAASGFEKPAWRHGASISSQHSFPGGVHVRKAWWRSSNSSEGSMSEGSADEDWAQNQSIRSQRVQHFSTCQADQTEGKDEEKARMCRSKSDPTRGNHFADCYVNKESKRKLSSKAFEQWLRKKDEEALDQEEKRIKAVERELKKLRHTKEVETDKARVPTIKGRVGSL